MSGRFYYCDFDVPPTYRALWLELDSAHAKNWLIERVQSKYYIDSYGHLLKDRLVEDLKEAGLYELRNRVEKGHFDF